ncbi:DUF1810 domain-containing protein [Litoribacter alkaliphilus]|uniref:DUF1810 domain-containing protein n=1 Tax=Litoribacter ruber TaxID=702568 RepID=A0AAP2CGE4_9BACT|nr:DUF1810 domain-containing protein [Litoribacter alkaliphilus]MBS9524146.1 DUF1810 domain-containing protein [Litoribacter alkaliphilus]
MGRVEDPYQLTRFLEAQASSLAQAKQELQNGKKVSHWMWYIFPQLKQLGHSSTAKFYGIRDLAEAKAFYQHPVLGHNLRECCELLLPHGQRTAYQIMGSPDDLKLRSCVTLFLLATGDLIFQQVLDQFFDGKKDEKTVAYIKQD